MTTRSAVALLLAGLSTALIAVDAVDAAQRTFVSTGGLDSNPCSLAAPCRAFAAAIGVTDPGGEIVVLDSGGYGAVTVNKNVSIVSPAGVYAGISVFAGQDGVTVAAPASNVSLRGLAINGQGGNVGIRVQAGDVHIENCVISNIGGVGAAGILIEGGTSVRISGSVVRSSTEGLRVLPAGSVTVLVRDSEFSHLGQVGIRVSPSGAGNNALVTVERTSVTRSSGYGIYSGPTGGGTATVVVTQSVLSEHAIAGVAAEAGGATAWVRESAVTRNGTGLRQLGAAVLNACGANLLVANTTATSGTINTSSCLDVAAGSGTVTSVDTGTGLSGGPITTTGTIVADTGYLQRRVSGTCGSGSSIRTINADGTVACEADDVGTGTVTSVATGTGLTGGPITGAGTVSIAAGGVGNAQLANASINVAKLDTVSTDGRYFKQSANAFGATARLGTSDNQAVEIVANGTRVMRFEPNAISPNAVGGNPSNSVQAGVRGATIAGGGVALGDSDPGYTAEAPNAVTDHYGTVSGGYANRAGDSAGTTGDAGFATVAGGRENTASGYVSAVSGGSANVASGSRSVVGGGGSNTAGALYSTVAGGGNGEATGVHATVGGGANAIASGVGATVGGGGAVLDPGCGPLCYLLHGNEASGESSTIPGGFGNIASGRFSLAAGRYSDARGDHSIALGHHAKAYNGANVGHGTIVIADGNDFDFNIGTDNRFAVRATGGIYLALGIDGAGNATWTCQASDGNAWACASDRNLKHSLVELDGKAVLAKLAAMPIYQWQPKGQNSHVKHYGPMAQDFHAAFGLGDDDTMIGMQDADGVALAAIQGLNAKLEATVAEQAREIEAQRAEIVEMRERVAQVEALRGELAAMKRALAAMAASRMAIATAAP